MGVSDEPGGPRPDGLSGAEETRSVTRYAAMETPLGFS